MPHWIQLDPYSSLEDEGNESQDSADKGSSTHEKVSSGDASDAVDVTAQQRKLRPRLRHYSSDHPRREASKNQFYHGMCDDKPN